MQLAAARHGERYKYKCLSKASKSVFSNAMSPARTRTHNIWSRDKLTNHKVTMPPTYSKNWTHSKLIIDKICAWSTCLNLQKRSRERESMYWHQSFTTPCWCRLLWRIHKLFWLHVQVCYCLCFFLVLYILFLFFDSVKNMLHANLYMYMCMCMLQKDMNL